MLLFYRNITVSFVLKISYCKYIEYAVADS